MSAQGWKLLAARRIKIPNRLTTSKNVEVRWCLKVCIYKTSCDETSDTFTTAYNIEAEDTQ